MHIQDSYDVQDNVIVGVDAVHESWPQMVYIIERIVICNMCIWWLKSWDNWSQSLYRVTKSWHHICTGVRVIFFLVKICYLPARFARRGINQTKFQVNI
jgi:hypothetical protein